MVRLVLLVRINKVRVLWYRYPQCLVNEQWFEHKRQKATAHQSVAEESN